VWLFLIGICQYLKLRKSFYFRVQILAPVKRATYAYKNVTGQFPTTDFLENVLNKYQTVLYR
jgi:hypothetical protein